MRPHFWFDDLPAEPIAPPQLTVYPSEPRDTGLVDKDGHAIMAAPEPIGFLGGKL